LDEATRHSFGATAFGHKLLQQAALARMRPGRVAEIRADGGIFKNRGRPPGRVRRASIASVLQEAQFEPENLQNVATVLSHKAPRLPARMPEAVRKLRACGHVNS